MCTRVSLLCPPRRFGKITEDKPQVVRNKYFAAAQAIAEDNAKSGGPLMGTLFWHWCVDLLRAAALARRADCCLLRLQV
jgi:hypothetical protein